MSACKVCWPSLAFSPLDLKASPCPFSCLSSLVSGVVVMVRICALILFYLCSFLLGVWLCELGFVSFSGLSCKGNLMMGPLVAPVCNHFPAPKMFYGNVRRILCVKSLQLCCLSLRY
ncbi:unnamed protein product [Arabidopsis halleri]